MDILSGIFCALPNFSILLFNQGFLPTAVAAISKHDPEVFSQFGQMMIVSWGVFYICVYYAKSKNRGAGLAPVWFFLFLEKLFYVQNYYFWHKRHPQFFQRAAYAIHRDPIGFFSKDAFSPEALFLFYGIIDLIFGFWFLMEVITAPSSIEEVMEGQKEKEQEEEQQQKQQKLKAADEKKKK